MPIAKLRALWRNIYDSLWFLPALFTLGAIIAAELLVRADDLLPGGTDIRALAWLFTGGPEGARGVLDAIAGSLITVTGVVFSVTVVALQLASSQFTPRVLRSFMADRANQLVLAVMIGTYVYSLLVMRTIRSSDDPSQEFVPAVATTFAGLLAVISIGFLIYYIDHAARSLQVDTIMSAVTREALDTIREEYPDLLGDTPDGTGRDDEEDVAFPDGPRTRVFATGAGFLTAVDEGRLLDVSRNAGCAVRMDVQVGDYVYPGTLLATLASDADEALVDKARGAFATGASRTPHQDVRLAVVELVDIAAKALSPGVNDPTTAMNSIDRMGELLLELGKRRRPRMRSAEDGATIHTNLPGFDDFTRLAFEQIARYAAGQVTVSERMVNVIGSVGGMLPSSRRAALRRLLTELEPVLMHPLQLQGDRDAVHVALARAERNLTPG
ncbi:MAG TPA: DUF2254 domain-containing protein [Longimicrobiales bacterium]|nr:DUF2254 domain-containing protein [Longimicrobiales bacterium]